jgi:hypothetical protein
VFPDKFVYKRVYRLRKPRCRTSAEARPKDFQTKYNSFSQKKALREHFHEVDDILELLFANNMIGYIESNGNMRWKHRETSVAMFDCTLPCEALQKNAQFKFHPALEKWVAYREESDICIGAISAASLMHTKGFTYPAALIALDWIASDPDTAIPVLAGDIKP